MRIIFSFLAAAAGVYSALLFVRIILSWFRNQSYTKPVQILKKLTDPYLDWWRNALKLRIGFLDFSVIAAIVFLSFIQNIFYTLSLSVRMTLGFILAQILLSLWNVFSVILGFFLIIIILRIFAYITNRNIYSPFWSVVENISQPLMYRMNRLIYGKKIGNFFQGLIISLIVFAVLLIGGRFLIDFIASLLMGFPI